MQAMLRDKVEEVKKPKAMVCDDCGQKWMKGDLFICPKCGHQWCMMCSFKGKNKKSLPLAEMFTCPKCQYVVSEKDHLTAEEYEKLREKHG